MAAKSELRADTAKSLAQLRAESSRPLAASLVEISRHQRLRSLEWSQTLECLYPIGADSLHRKRRRLESCVSGHDEESARPQLGRRPVKLTSHDFVAVSYTWTKPSREAVSEGGYQIQSRGGGESDFSNSIVRDAVLDRALAFAGDVGCDNIWIDNECIDQDDEPVKEKMVQSMDLVYSASGSSVALLTHGIETEDELELLAGLLQGKFVEKVKQGRDSHHALVPSLSTKTPDMLRLLDFLISDLWWTRAWTFQENYKSSANMKLLIPCNPALESSPIGEGTFGRFHGELWFSSLTFHVQATRFCEAYRRSRADSSDVCEKILARAARYTILLEEFRPEGRGIYRSMSPQIFEDVGRRDIEREADRLAIAANCCQYSLRLDSAALADSSLSLALLSLYALNGEILDNSDDAAPASLSDDIFGFLKKQSLDSFQSSMEYRLTFIKSCRFGNVQLTLDGIQTSGWLWKAGRRIPAPRRRGRTGLGATQLAALARYLASQFGYGPLADCIKTYLATAGKDGFMADFQGVMAGKIIDAIQDGKGLRPARLIDPMTGTAIGPYTGLFVDDLPEDAEPDELYFFTAEFAAEQGAGGVDKHVSLEVERRGFTDERLARLVIRRWASGLSFHEGVAYINETSDDSDASRWSQDSASETETSDDGAGGPFDVVFPWPAALVV